MGNAASKLTEAQKVDVVLRLAGYDSPAAIARSLKDEFGIKITGLLHRMSMIRRAYGAAVARSDGRRCSTKRARKIVAGLSDIGAANKMVRVRWLDQMARSEMAAKTARRRAPCSGRPPRKWARASRTSMSTTESSFTPISAMPNSTPGFAPPPNGSPQSLPADARQQEALAVAAEVEGLLELTEQRAARNKLATLYPETGPLRRELYAKHMIFFAAGRTYQERCMMAANRVGKTWGVGGYETALHLTGRYPDWWEGRRFATPIEAWVAGDTAETTRDIVQAALMGPPAGLGTGLIPADAIVGEPSRRSGATGAIDTARIRHVSGGVSLLGFKSYDQGRRKFQGTAKHAVWLDEEPPADVYDECMLRLMTTDGLMLCTFTPLNGLTEIVRRFLPHLAGTGEGAMKR